MTDSELVNEAEWMMEFVEREWRGCKPASRFARSLPLMLEAFLRLAKDKSKSEVPSIDGKETCESD